MKHEMEREGFVMKNRANSTRVANKTLKNLQHTFEIKNNPTQTAKTNCHIKLFLFLPKPYTGLFRNLDVRHKLFAQFTERAQLFGD